MLMEFIVALQVVEDVGGVIAVAAPEELVEIVLNGNIFANGSNGGRGPDDGK